METTVTGVFAADAQARAVVDQLVKAGFARENVMLVTADTPHRHELIGEETADSTRGAMFGAMVGGVAATVAAVAVFASFPGFGVHAVWGGIGGAVFGVVGGGVIGFLVGSATGHQVQEEYEHVLDAGSVMVAVNTGGTQATKAHELLAAAGAAMLSTSVHRKHHHPTQQAV